MRYAHLAAVAWIFVLGFSLAGAGAAASDSDSFRLDIGTSVPGIEQLDIGEKLPNYWTSWTKESAFARSVRVDLRNSKEEAVERLGKNEPGMVHSEENNAKELTLSDVGVGTLKVVGTAILVPIVLTGYLGLLFVEGMVESGASFGFD